MFKALSYNIRLAVIYNNIEFTDSKVLINIHNSKN